MDKDLEKAKLSTFREERDFASAVTKFIGSYGESFAVLYTPSECFLLKIGKDGVFQKHSGRILPANVYEARIFNKTAELRWFNDNGEGIAVTLSEINTNDDFGGDVLLKHPQNYLIWGKKIENSQNDWTQFATARIGEFSIPCKVVNKDYAQFTAIEYLKEFEDGNVAVFEERLTGISEVGK